MLWLPHDDHVLGWFIGDQGGRPLAAYFVLQEQFVRHWRYDAPGADTGVLAQLSRLWPLDCVLEA